ncbi:scavenger receptor cysteine-rich type 1 protein M130-like [Dunckerocampus dactyliophorus]|uniref:scavenger receptor cysteine-rich type 1 protein M130-like n=1 Tax=Dunckerocampus dactyliophorus TaxID=161453 RepID=UPI00240546ED|nr:scavenger receptor cysteine-rich type 1 protein M130-like [Dunckerocampus dactyliophorus]XP_054634678.1 scavenger receptor cysteine-rich type 1 protein M130-like [Dunckerocampus dactyliophorus]
MSQRHFLVTWSSLVFLSFDLLVTEISSLKTPQQDPSQTNIDDARLVGGESRCTGQLELKHHRKWRVLTMQQGRRSASVAQVACTQMDCGSLISIQHKSNNDHRPAWEVQFRCHGLESTLMECKDYVGAHRRVQGRNSTSDILEVACSESLRLVGNGHICSGDVEVKTDQGWTTVCEEGFDLAAKTLVCRELGCGPPSHFIGSFGRKKEGGLLSSRKFHCKGNETRLQDCANSTHEDCRPAPAVRCQVHQAFQMVGGDNRCAGIVEGKDAGEWRPLADKWHQWNTEHLSQLCTQLDCGSFISTTPHFLPREEAVWALDSFCADRSASICTEWEPDRSDHLMTVTCSASVRLLAGRDRCSGNVMVKSSQSWWPMCDSVFSAEDALVVCGELDCGVPRDYHSRTSSGQNLQQWAPAFKCEGKEQKLQECPSLSFNATEENCGKVYITCIKNPTKPQASVHSAHTDGTHVLKGHHFAITCSHNSRYSIRSFRLKTGVYAEHLTEWTEAAADNSATFLFPAAQDSHKGVYYCDYNYELRPTTFSEPKAISLTVQEPRDLRLVEGGSPCAGKLELKHNKDWRPVSYQNTWSLKEAAVVCRQLGCGLVVSTTKQHKTSAPVPVWRFYSDCEGSELALMDCGTVTHRHSSWTVQVICSDILPQPNISFFSGYTGETQQGVTLLHGYSFTITCSVEPHYPEGHFSLKFKQTASRSLPAVKHSARFVFPTAHALHTGNYTCVYHNFVFGRNFSSVSHSLSLSVTDDVDLVLDDGEPAHNDSVSCAGKLLVRHEDEMRLLSAASSSWDLKHASVVCRQLGCGAALSTKATHLANKEAVWRFFSDCNGSESALMDCGSVARWFSSSAVVVVCAGHNGATKEE